MNATMAAEHMAVQWLLQRIQWLAVYHKGCGTSVLTGELSLSCGRPTAGLVNTLWGKLSATGSQPGRLSLLSFRGR